MRLFDPGDDGQIDVGGAGRLEGPGAAFGCGAGGENVVDQEDVGADDAAAP